MHALPRISTLPTSETAMDEFFVSEQAAIVPPAITNNSESSLVVVWGVQGAARLVGALFDLGGNPISREFAVNTSQGTVCSRPAAAHVRSGFAVTWIEGSPARVVVRRFDREGTPTGAPLQVNQVLPMAGFGPAIARSPDRNSIVCWVGEDSAVHAMAFDDAGNSRGPAFKVSSTAGSHTGPVRAIGLENNSFAVCWPDGLGNVLLQVLQTSGAPVGDARTLDIFRFGDNFAIAPIVDQAPGTEPGHFALVHVTSALPEGQRLVIGTVFGPSGAVLGNGSFNITQRDRNTIASNPAMAALPSRRFLVTWSEERPPGFGDTTGMNVAAMLCSEDRGPLPGAADVDLGGLIPALEISTSPGHQSLPCAGFAMNFETGEQASMVVWLDDMGDSNVPTRAVKGRVLDRSGMPA